MNLHMATRALNVPALQARHDGCGQPGSGQMRLMPVRIAAEPELPAAAGGTGDCTIRERSVRLDSLQDRGPTLRAVTERLGLGMSLKYDC